MKSLIFVLSLLAAAVCLPASADADPGPSMSLGGNIVWPGLGILAFGGSAVEHPDGTVSGSIVLSNTGTDIAIQVDVKCLYVEGNKATFGGTVRKGVWLGQDLTGYCMVSAAVDNGEGPDSPPDLIAGQYYDSCGNLPAETACTTVVMHPPIPVHTGNVQVRP